MRKFLGILILALIPGVLGADIFDDIQKIRTFQLADAYYQVGQKYVELGKKDLGEACKARALALFPDYLNPDKHPKTTQKTPETPVNPVEPTTNPDTSVKTPVVLDRPQVRQNSIQGEKIVSYQFSKLLRAFINRDADGTLEVIGDTLLVPQKDPLTKEALQAQVKDFFEKNDTSLYSPSQLVQSKQIRAGAEKESYVVAVESTPQANLTGLLPFWKDQVSLTFKRFGDTWKLVSVE